MAYPQGSILSPLPNGKPGHPAAQGWNQEWNKTKNETKGTRCPYDRSKQMQRTRSQNKRCQNESNDFGAKSQTLLKFCTDEIGWTNSHTYLGVCFDHQLSFE